MWHSACPLSTALIFTHWVTSKTHFVSIFSKNLFPKIKKSVSKFVAEEMDTKSIEIGYKNNLRGGATAMKAYMGT